MSEENLNQHGPSSDDGSEYQAPEVEEVVSREVLEREVAYAGTQAPSLTVN